MSSISLTQMIGRGLRGKKAGAGQDKEIANIVFFGDTWKKVINFATPGTEGGKENVEPTTRGYYPIEYIAIRLIEELSRKIDSGAVFADEDYLEQIPIGWYETEVLINVEEETDLFKEFIIVYQNTKEKFERFIKEISSRLSPEWENENLADGWMQDQINRNKWIESYFDKTKDNVSGTLDLDLINIARHMTQAGRPPIFYTFKERDKHNLSKIAFDAVQKRMDDLTIDELLQHEFHLPDKLWKTFYKDYQRFASAFDAERRRAIHIIKYGSEPTVNVETPTIVVQKRELTEDEKEQVFRRDNYTCLCCGKFRMKGKRVKFEVDHITPSKFGGQATTDNSQTLCSICNNSVKGINEINFRIHETPLSAPKENLDVFVLSVSEAYDFVLRRTVNFFYHCWAVAEIKCDTRPRSKYRYHWEIQLYAGNNPEWLNQHKEKLITFIRKTLKYGILRELTIR